MNKWTLGANDHNYIPTPLHTLHIMNKWIMGANDHNYIPTPLHTLHIINKWKLGPNDHNYIPTPLYTLHIMNKWTLGANDHNNILTPLHTLHIFNKGNAKRAVSPHLKIRPCDLDLWPWKSIWFHILLRSKYVPSLVKIHLRRLILECSQGCYRMTDGR